LQSVDKYIF